MIETKEVQITDEEALEKCRKIRKEFDDIMDAHKVNMARFEGECSGYRKGFVDGLIGGITAILGGFSLGLAIKKFQK